MSTVGIQLAWSWCAATALFGAIVGGCELIGRYRDAPLEALRNPAARLYVLVNALAAVGAYALIVRLDWGFGVAEQSKALVQAGVASFGAMAFFRSSLFNVRVGETDLAVGPAILFQILTFATDRAVDRTRGTARSDLAAEIMRGVSFTLAKEALPNYCFELMQNVPLDEQQSFRMVVNTLASASSGDMRDSVKALNLGLMLMNVVGKQVLATAVRALGERIQGPSALEVPVLGKLRGVIFERAFPTLVDVCFVMSKYGTEAEQAVRKTLVMAEGRSIGDSISLDNDSKVTMLALSLQQRVGDAVLLSALVQLDPALYDRSPAAQTPKTVGEAANVLPLRQDRGPE